MSFTDCRIFLMAKHLKFSWENQTVAFDMEKVDRTKLYGTKSLEVVDENDGAAAW